MAKVAFLERVLPPQWQVQKLIFFCEEENLHSQSTDDIAEGVRLYTGIRYC